MGGGKGLPSSTFRLNLTRLCRRKYTTTPQEVFTLRCKVDEFKPLEEGAAHRRGLPALQGRGVRV